MRRCILALSLLFLAACGPEGGASGGEDTAGSALPVWAAVGIHGWSADAPRRCDPRLTTAFGSPLVLLPPGTFRMGSGEGDPVDSFPDHDVTLTRAFWIGELEVTQSEWAAGAVGEEKAPSAFRGAALPVERVSWTDVARHLNALSAAEGLPPCYAPDGSAMLVRYAADPASCPGYRLPTESEWEYAARAGSDEAYAGGSFPDAVAWYHANSDGSTHEVGGLRPNAWGLYDMSGNVKEWTNDWFDPAWGDDGEPQVDPAGPAQGLHRSLRGGSWYYGADYTRVTYRYAHDPLVRDERLGFRVARTCDAG